MHNIHIYTHTYDIHTPEPGACEHDCVCFFTLPWKRDACAYGDSRVLAKV